MTEFATTMLYETKEPKVPFLGWLFGYHETSSLFALRDNTWRKAAIVTEEDGGKHLFVFEAAEPKMQFKLHKMYDKINKYAEEHNAT